MLRPVGILLTVLAIAAQADARRIVLSCQQGYKNSERIRGARTGGRSYPFCQFNTFVNEGGCTFAFCPSLAYVVACKLNLQCVGPEMACDPASAGEMRDEFFVKGGQRLALKQGADTVILKCRPGVQLQVPQF